MPSAGSRGLATGDGDALRERTLGAWDAFLEMASEADLSAPSRLPGWTGRDVVAHLGSWEQSPMGRILHAAETGESGPWQDPDTANAELLARHADADGAAVLAAVRRARDAVAAFFGSPEQERLGLRPAQSLVGPLPVLTIVNGAAFELAVHARDLVPCGAPEPPAALSQAGLAALVDVTAALAVRVHVRVDAAVLAPDGGWRARALLDSGDWETHQIPPGTVTGTAVLGTAADVLDISAGRAFAPLMLAQRKIKVQDLAGMIAMTPIVTAVPGIPGGRGLILAARALGGVGGALGRLPKLPRFGR